MKTTGFLFLGVLLVVLSGNSLGHGGVPPAGINNYPPGMLSPILPNRLPFCAEIGATAPCGLESACLSSETSQPLGVGVNELLPGQVFEIPWLVAVVHNNTTLIDVRLRSADGLQSATLLSGFPQGNAGTGDVMVLLPLAIPANFAPGLAVLQIDDGTYFDCVDLRVAGLVDLIFSAGFE